MFDHDKIYVSKKYRVIGTVDKFNSLNTPMEKDDIYLVTNVTKEYFDEHKEDILRVLDIKFNDEEMTAEADISFSQLTYADKLSFKYQILNIYLSKAIEHGINEQRLFTFSLDNEKNVIYTFIIAPELIASSFGFTSLLDVLASEKADIYQCIPPSVKEITIPVSSYIKRNDKKYDIGNIENITLDRDTIVRVFGEYVKSVKAFNKEHIIDKACQIAALSYEELSQKIGVVTQEKLEQAVIKLSNDLKRK